MTAAEMTSTLRAAGFDYPFIVGMISFIVDRHEAAMKLEGYDPNFGGLSEAFEFHTKLTIEQFAKRAA